MPNPDQPLTRKELAAVLGMSIRFVTYLKKQGFPMPGGWASESSARAWIATHPRPCPRSKIKVFV